MSLLLHTLPRFVIAFLPRSKQASFDFMPAVTVCIDFEAQENKISVSVVSRSIRHKVIGPDAMIFVSCMLSFKPAFSLSSFTFIKRLFSFSLLSAIRVVSSAYLRLLTFLPASLIPGCASSSPAFRTMYSAYKLNKQGDNIQPWLPSQFFLFVFLKVYLAVSGLSWGTWDLCCCSAWALEHMSSGLVAPRHVGIWDLSSLTRGQTCILCIARQILNLWTTREVPLCQFWTSPLFHVQI